MELCEQHGIKKHFRICKTPQQNGVAQRINKTIDKKARCFRLNAWLAKNFWVEAVNMEVYFMFLVLDYSGLRVFGFLAYMYIYSNERSKLDAKSRQYIFLGYQKGVKGFKHYDPKANKMVISRDVFFLMKKPCYNVLKKKRNRC